MNDSRNRGDNNRKYEHSASTWDKFSLLVWKNWVLQLRKPNQTIIEIVSPVLFSILLVIVRSLVSPTQNDTLMFKPFCPIAKSNPEQCDLTEPPSKSELTGYSILYTPMNNNTEKMMEMVPTANLKTIGFNSSKELIQYYTSNTKILVAVEFDELNPDKDILVKIRFPSELRSLGSKTLGETNDWKTNLLYPIYQLRGPRNPGLERGGDPSYADELFLTIQQVVTMRLIDVFQGRTDIVQRFPYIHVERFPHYAWTEDFLLQALQGFSGMVVMLSFCYTCIHQVKMILNEKEKQLKEAMKMMGLPNWLHWVAWFVKSLSFLIISAVLITILLKIKWKNGHGVFTYTNATVLFTFFLLYICSIITFSFAVSAFFSKANSAATAGSVLWFITYVPYVSLVRRYDWLSLGEKLSTSIFMNTAMSYGLGIMFMFEGSGEGSQWNNLTKGGSPDDTLTLALIFSMLIFDTLFYLLIALYVEAVYPGSFGTPKPFYFPFTKSFWSRTGKRPKLSRESSEVRIADYLRPFFEAEPTNLRAGVKIRNLRKVFKGNVAVNNLSMNMYEDQITVLLGHNGAGKTTTMSILTGMFPPTSGTAIINGYDIRTDMNGVRSSLGLCPQHNILFDELTVSEHLYFFSKLKGTRKEEIPDEIQKYINLLKLGPKAQSKSMTLSGGMKRKLCVAIALCGGSKVVMLDEPTAGMDPTARRALWELIQLEKKGRTMLLTTHFMDEADLLGDRIAIMARGRLKCCGSSFFLKKKYGAGYNLILDKSKDCNPEAVRQLLQKYIPNIEIESNVGSELSFLLPESSVNKFEQMFKELEENQKALGINSYGVSLTTLEEVFMKVGAGDDNISKHSIIPLLNADYVGTSKTVTISDEDPLHVSGSNTARSSVQMESMEVFKSDNGNMSNVDAFKSVEGIYKSGEASFKSIEELDKSKEASFKSVIEDEESFKSLKDVDKSGGASFKSAGSINKSKEASFKSAESTNRSNEDSFKSAEDLNISKEVSFKSATNLDKSNDESFKSAQSMNRSKEASFKSAESMNKSNEDSFKSAQSSNDASFKSAESMNNKSKEASFKSAEDLDKSKEASFKSVREASKSNEDIFKSVEDMTESEENVQSAKFAKSSNQAPNNRRDGSQRIVIEESFHQFLTGVELIRNQYLAMLMKKLLSVIRSYRLHLIVLSIPVIMIGITMLVLNVIRDVELPALDMVMRAYKKQDPIILTETDNADNPYYAKFRKLSIIGTINQVPNVSTELLKLTKENSHGVRFRYLTAASFKSGEGAQKPILTAWFNNDPYHTAPIALGMVLNSVYQNLMDNNNRIHFINHPLPFKLSTQFAKITSGNTPGFHISFNFGFSMTFVAAFFILFIIRERITKSKHLQFVSGVKVLIYWTSAFFCDMMIFIVIHIAVLATLVGFQEEGFTDPDDITRIFVILVFFSYAVLPCVYFMGYFFDTPSSGYTRLCLIGILVGNMAFLILQMLKIPALDVKDVADALHWLFLLIPHYAMCAAIFQNYNIYSLNKYCKIFVEACQRGNSTVDCENEACVKLEDHCCKTYYQWAQPGLTANFFYMIFVGSLMFIVIIMNDYKMFNTILERWDKGKGDKKPMEVVDEDSDVVAEKKRIREANESDLKNEHMMVMKDVTKYYKNYLAVNGLCLGIKQYECFGLLGINGAGKTTTFMMLTGDIKMTNGKAWVRGYSINNELKMVQKYIGYCPQFDALLDDLTAKETLIMFCLLRGIRKSECRRIARKLSKDFDFMNHINKQVKELSGGNKRKLSTAISLIGDPPVLYLDEPTTGMDPATKRFLWNAICKVRDNGKCIVLTSHSMEECEALCTKIAIMVNGNFKCLGSTQHLKSKFAEGYTLTIKVKKPEFSFGTEHAPTELIKLFVEKNFKKSVLREEHQELLTYYIYDKSMAWSTMFGILERGKNELEIEDYSLGQSSLEQVFLTFTKHQQSDTDLN